MPSSYFPKKSKSAYSASCGHTSSAVIFVALRLVLCEGGEGFVSYSLRGGERALSCTLFSGEDFVLYSLRGRGLRLVLSEGGESFVLRSLKEEMALSCFL